MPRWLRPMRSYDVSRKTPIARHSPVLRATLGLPLASGPVEATSCDVYQPVGVIEYCDGSIAIAEEVLTDQGVDSELFGFSAASLAEGPEDVARDDQRAWVYGLKYLVQSGAMLYFKDLGDLGDVNATFGVRKSTPSGRGSGLPALPLRSNVYYDPTLPPVPPVGTAGIGGQQLQVVGITLPFGLFSVHVPAPEQEGFQIKDQLTETFTLDWDAAGDRTGGTVISVTVSKCVYPYGDLDITRGGVYMVEGVDYDRVQRTITFRSGSEPIGNEIVSVTYTPS